jgi:hypothetical protein
VILKRTLGYLGFELTLPLQNVIHRYRLRGAVRVIYMLVIAHIIALRELELNHEDVHTELGCKLNSLKHALLEFGTLADPTAITHGGYETKLDGLRGLHDGNILAVYAGQKPDTSVLSEVFVYREKN